MTTPSLIDYIQEYEAIGIGDLLYNLIAVIVKRIASNYPAAFYSKDGTWDEAALEDITQEFTLEWLLERGQLEYYLLAVETTTSLNRGLAKAFKQYLVNNRRRTEYSNLFMRARRCLKENEAFQPYGRTSQSAEIWGLANWDKCDVEQQLETVVNAMYQVPLNPPVRYRADSKKLSHVIAQSDLKRLLHETFRFIGNCISFDLIVQALRYRLNLFEVDEVSFQEIIATSTELAYEDVISLTTSIENEISAVATAEDIFERLTDRQRAILPMYLSSPSKTLDQLSYEIGVSKSTIHNDIRSIDDQIRANLDGAEAEQTLHHLSQMCEALSKKKHDS